MMTRILIMTTLLFGVNTGLPEANADTWVVLDEIRQLFLDDYLIDSMKNMTRTVHQASKHPDNPIVQPTEPWEDNIVLIFGSVIRDNGKYRMWYYGGGGLSYAESNDGIKWKKIIHDFVEKDGRKTNILVKCQYKAEMYKQTQKEYDSGVPNAIPFLAEAHGVHKDNLETDPSRRYKMTYTTGGGVGMGVAYSADGINWKLARNWVTRSSRDIRHLMFDTTRGKWVLYGRAWNYHSPEVHDAWGENEYFKKHNRGRAVIRLESSDLME